MPQLAQNKPRLYRLLKNLIEATVLKGHGFSHAATSPK